MHSLTIRFPSLIMPPATSRYFHEAAAFNILRGSRAARAERVELAARVEGEACGGGMAGPAPKGAITLDEVVHFPDLLTPSLAVFRSTEGLYALEIAPFGGVGGNTHAIRPGTSYGLLHHGLRGFDIAGALAA